MKKQEYDSDLDECKHKLDRLLTEYNAEIEFDLELNRVILVDKDTQKFVFVD